MSKQSIITMGQLRKLDACRDQRDLFIDTWGDSVVVTEEEMVKHASKFDWDWAASNLLADCPNSHEASDRYEEFRELVRPAEKERKSALDVIRNARREAEEAAVGSEAKEKAYNDGSKKMQDAMEHSDKKMEEANARAFAQMYIKRWETKDGNATEAASSTKLADDDDDSFPGVSGDDPESGSNESESDRSGEDVQVI